MFYSILFQISFEVDYTFTDTSYLRDFQIAIGTLSTLGVIYAGYRTWVWSKRAGRPTIDFPTIANFFFFCAGTLSNVFFVVSFGMSFYWLIFFKVTWFCICAYKNINNFKNFVSTVLYIVSLYQDIDICKWLWTMASHQVNPTNFSEAKYWCYWGEYCSKRKKAQVKCICIHWNLKIQTPFPLLYKYP